MAEEFRTGRIKNRNDLRYDWIVSDGFFRYDVGKLLMSPFFRVRENWWRMTLHCHQKVVVCVANKESDNKGGYVFKMGLLNKDGGEIFIGQGMTNEIGMCAINSEIDVHRLRYHMGTCGGRLIVFCKFQERCVQPSQQVGSSVSSVT